ncbi:MAG: hypothetical protein GYB67_13445 [Chloroflexi bacterium]|nr:hypothetical protein [Chloroflexota bacterium]
MLTLRGGERRPAAQSKVLGEQLTAVGMIQIGAEGRAFDNRAADAVEGIDALITRHEIKKAEILIARQLRAAPDVAVRAALMVLRARARLYTTRPDEALDDLQHARDLDPDVMAMPETLQLLGDSHFARFELASVGFADRADTSHALAAYDELLAHFPAYDNIGWVHYQRGRILLTEDHIEQAVNCFQQALLSPSTVAAQTAYCYERLGFVAFYESRDLKQATLFLSKAIDTFPANADRVWLVQVHTLRGRVFREMQQYERALDAAQTAIRVASAAGVDGRRGLADALLTFAEIAAPLPGHETDVIAALQQFLQISKRPLGIDVTWSRVYEMLSEAYFKTGQHQSAVAACAAALQCNPYHPWEMALHYRMARSYYQLGAYEQTIGAINAMLSSAAADGQTVDDYRVFNVLGNAQFALGHYQQAADAYETALGLAPLQAAHLDTLRKYHRYAQQLRRPN